MKPLLLLFSLVAFAFSLPADTLEAVLSRMDRTAPNFHGASANIEMVTHTAILNDDTDEKGTLQMQQMNVKNVRAIVDFSAEKDKRILAFAHGKVRIYYPNLKTYQDYDLGGKSNLLNQFLLLGFGSSGRDLAKNYTITLAGSEPVAGQQTSKLQLIPKDKEVLEHLTKVEVWIPDNGSAPVQQKFYEPNTGNYRLVTYSNVQVNPPLGPGPLELKLPPGVKQQRQ